MSNEYKLLTIDGLRHLLQKVAALFNTCVTKQKNETITGLKTFSNGIVGNVTGNVTGNLTGNVTGNCSGSASKLASARTISVGDLEFQGTANFDGSGNATLNVTHHRSIVSVGNTNNYPFHRIAYTPVETGNYLDRCITFFIGREYNSSGYGICRIILRTNNAASNATANCDVQWLVRTSGMPADTIQVGFNNTAKASYVDVFYKSNGTYASAVCRVLSHANSRSTVGRGFAVIANSTEVSNTTASDALTSTESYASIAAAGTAIRGQAYTSTIAASDVGVVGSCTGNAATATKATQDGSGNAIASTYLPLAGGKMTGNLKLQCSDQNQLRLIQGNYGVILRNDGSNFYFLQTASGSAESGSWNSARPMTINLSSGVCNINGNAANVTGTVAIANGGTGATTRLNALKALTNENVGTNAQYFLTITSSWGKGGYSSTANAKTVLGISGSDRRIKQDIEAIPEEVLDAWDNVRWKQFKMRKDVRQKGDNAKLQVGAVVQDIQEVFADAGLDSGDYGFLYQEDYPESERDLPSEENSEVANGDKWYLKYEQAYAIEAMYLRRKVKMLEERLSALEAKL